MSKHCGKKLISYYRRTDRIIMVKINTKPTITTIIQVYIPITDDDWIWILIQAGENINILGNWNVSVREQSEKYIVAKYDLGKRNETRFKQFYTQHKLVLVNTIPQNHKMRRYIREKLRSYSKISNWLH